MWATPVRYVHQFNLANYESTLSIPMFVGKSPSSPMFQGFVSLVFMVNEQGPYWYINWIGLSNDLTLGVSNYIVSPLTTNKALKNKHLKNTTYHTIYIYVIK
jgi:hypothetical protein